MKIQAKINEEVIFFGKMFFFLHINNAFNVLHMPQKIDTEILMGNTTFGKLN